MKCLKKIKEIWDKHKIKVKIGGTVTAEVAKLTSPIVAVSVEGIKAIFENFNDIQCQMILDGLKKSENIEMRLNQLYSFSKKKDGAHIISKLGEQAALSKSTKALVILGIMLSECMEGQMEPSYEDMIVMNALQTATDYEIEYIKEIYDNYVDEDRFINETEISKASLAEEYRQTLEWGTVNRVIGKTDIRHACGFDIVGEYLVVNKYTEKLMHYILEARQVLGYYV